MTKKDYKKIAGIFARAYECTNREIMWNYLQGEMAAVLAADNPRFDREKFDEACNSGDEN